MFFLFFPQTFVICYIYTLRQSTLQSLKQHHRNHIISADQLQIHSYNIKHGIQTMIEWYWGTQKNIKPSSSAICIQGRFGTWTPAAKLWTYHLQTYLLLSFWFAHFSLILLFLVSRNPMISSALAHHWFVGGFVRSQHSRALKSDSTWYMK